MGQNEIGHSGTRTDGAVIQWDWRLMELGHSTTGTQWNWDITGLGTEGLVPMGL